MAQEKQGSSEQRVSIALGADDQLAALEHLWAQGERSDPHADEAAWQTLRRALSESRRAIGARPLFPDE